MTRFMARIGVCIAAGVIACAAFGWIPSGVKLYVNGKVASSDVLVKDGVAYVPLKDIAAALDMTAEKKPDGFALVRAGGANQVNGVNGKIGDDLFNGLFRLTVVKIVRGETYKRQFSKGDDVTAPAGEEIVAIIMRIKNGTKDTQLIDLVYPGSHTALTDENEHSFEAYTGLASDVPSRAANLVPGAATDTALVFHVPKSAVLKDLIFGVGNGLKPGPDFRISLKQ